MSDQAELFITRSRYYLQTEYRTKLRAAVDALPPDALWWRPNEQSNSVGNLLMHLAGNIRQWIVSGVGGAPSTRDRAAEFAATSGVGTAGLLATLDQALDDVDAVLASLSASDLLSTRTIQGRELSVLDGDRDAVERLEVAEALADVVHHDHDSSLRGRSPVITSRVRSAMSARSAEAA